MRRSGNIFCWLLVVSLLAGGCRTETYMPSTDVAAREIRVTAGDRISVLTTRRERLTFDITEIRSDRLLGVIPPAWETKESPSGTTVEVPFDEMAIVNVTRFHSGAAAVATAAAVLTVTAIGAVIGAAALPVVPVVP